MKQLKTILTVFVVFAMLVSSVGVFAAETTAKTTNFSDVPAGTPVADAVAKLVGYGVINGYDDNNDGVAESFKPDNTITRAEFAAIITRFKGIEGATNAVTGFADLDNDESRAWARPYVKAAADAGIINGFEDGTFRAGEPVTYEQAVKMIVCAIGYEPVAKSEYNKQQALGSANITWSTGYIMAASKNGITKNAATANVTGPATRGTVAILTSNAYEVPKLNQNVDANGNISYEKDEGTYGDDRYDAQEKITGTVVATCYTALDDADPDLEINEIIIDVNKEGETTYELSDALAKSLDLEDLIGKRVSAYYSNNEFALTSISEEKNSITEIEESQINRPLKGASISYVENGRNKSITVNGCTFIYNGKAEYIDNLDDLDEIFTNGYIEVNETTNVVKVTSYDVMVVNSYNKNEGNGKVYLKYNDKYNGNNYYEFPSGGTSSKPEIYVNGTKKAFDSFSLSAYNVINYYESPDVGGRKIRKMFVTTGSKTGKITAILDGERVIELNDTEKILTNEYNEYTPSSGSDKKAPFEMNDNYTYYLDHTGQIAAINYNPAAQGSFEIGYVIGADAKDGKIKIVRKNGTAQIFNLKNKIKFDGQSISSGEIVTALQDVADTELAGSDMQVSYYQPVKFSLSSGEISAIDSVKEIEGGNDDSFCVNALYEGTDVKPSTTSVKVDGTTYQLASSTVVMYVPEDRKNEGEFAVMTPSKAFSVSQNRQVEIFGADESGKVKTASLVLVYGINPSLVLTGSSPYMIVTRKFGGEQDKLEGFKSGAKEVSEVTISEDKFIVDASNAWVSYESVEKGDVVRLLESGGEVVAIEMIYDVSEKEDNLNMDCPDIKDDGLRLYDSDSNDLYVYYAEIFEKQPNNEETKISVTKDFGDDQDAKIAAMETVTVNASTVYYSVDGNDIIAGESMDVMVDEVGSESKVIFVRTGSSTAAAKLFYVVK